jgi:hypothetical protein
MDLNKNLYGKIKKFKIRKMVLEEGNIEKGWKEIENKMKGFVKYESVKIRKKRKCGGWFF